MIQKEHYLYSHTRNDTNQIFYIGIGTVKKNQRYKRAHDKDRRNPIWASIVKKAGYSIQILIESTDYDFIKAEEIRLISLYGKIKDKTGILSNIADGGEGNLGYKPSIEIIEAQKKRMTGRKASEKTKLAQSKAQRNKFVSPEVGLKISKNKMGIKLLKKSDNRPKYLKHLPTGLVFPSISLAANNFNIRAGLLGRDIISKKNTEFIIISKSDYIKELEFTKQIFPKNKRVAQTEEHKRKISESNKGKIHSEESKLKMSIVRIGIILSETHRNNISKNSPRNIPIKNSLTGEVFKNITDAAKTINITSEGLSHQLASGHPYCLFEFLNKESMIMRKKAIMFKNIITNEIFLTIDDVIKKENIKKSTALARTDRKSKNWNYIRIKMDYIEYLQNKINI